MASSVLSIACTQTPKLTPSCAVLRPVFPRGDAGRLAYLWIRPSRLSPLSAVGQGMLSDTTEICVGLDGLRWSLAGFWSAPCSQRRGAKLAGFLRMLPRDDWASGKTRWQNNVQNHSRAVFLPVYVFCFCRPPVCLILRNFHGGFPTGLVGRQSFILASAMSSEQVGFPTGLCVNLPTGLFCLVVFFPTGLFFVSSRTFVVLLVSLPCVKFVLTSLLRLSELRQWCRVMLAAARSHSGLLDGCY